MSTKPNDSDLPEVIHDPFDPATIKISRKVVPINLIIDRIDYDEIDLAPDFQRKARIWDTTRKSRLIESILLRIPLPVFYVASDSTDNWKVVDGLQRLTTIYDFIKGEDRYKFPLRGLEYLVPYEGIYYDALPRSIKRRIDETELNVNVIESGTPDSVMFNIFRRLNTGGISLNSQEIRNALHPGPVRNFLRDLAQCEEFRSATGNGVRDDRMGARELALRFCAFQITKYEFYQAADLDGFLSEAMARINDMTDSDRANLEYSFRVAMTRCTELFGEVAFRKSYAFESRRSPINRALFEALSVNAAQLSPISYHRLRMNRDILLKDYHSLFLDVDFSRSISLSTGSRLAVFTRFKKIREIMKVNEDD